LEKDKDAKASLAHILFVAKQVEDNVALLYSIPEGLLLQQA